MLEVISPKGSSRALLYRLLDRAETTRPERPRLNDRPLFLYGAGALGQLARDFLIAVGRPPAFVFDGSNFSFSDPRSVRVAVSIVTSPYEPISRYLRGRGHDDVVPFYDLAQEFSDRHPLSLGWFAEPPTLLDRVKIVRTWESWDDESSRLHYLQFIAWRYLREELVFDGVRVDNRNRYFIPEVVNSLRYGETLLDGGAYVGDVSRRCLSLPDCFLKVLAVEPDIASCRELYRNFEGDSRVSILNCALAAQDGYALFAEGCGLTSRIWEHGGRCVTTRAIDSLDVAPSFIKLHLEGGELDALRGARKTLVKYRPIVVASVDHNDDGIWRMADYLMRLLRRYKFLFRNHCWCGAGAVIYAIPEERSE